MARPRRTDEQLVTSARQVVQQTQDIRELRQALAVLLPAELNASLEQTALVLGVGRATVPRLQSGFRRRRCDVCLGREIPACVAACPTGALATEAPPDRPARSEFKGHVVVVGSSAAGIAACESAREHAPGCSITLVTADASPYSRPLLSY